MKSGLRRDVLSAEQVGEFEEAFYLLDGDGDGRITINELENAIKTLIGNPSREELRFMIREVDVNGNGTIEFGEFFNLMTTKIKEAESAEELKEAFKVFDKDQDGYISTAELKYGMLILGEKITEEEVAEMVRVADMDGDGRISYEEFVKMMCAPYNF